MSDTRIFTLRTTARTPWGFMAYAATTLSEVNPIALETARKDNLRTVQDRLTPQVTFPGHTVRTPVADTTITVSEMLVEQDPMGEADEQVTTFDEYEIEFWRM